MHTSEQIDQQIAELTDWRGDVMKKVRKLIHQADPEIQEEWKWGTGVYVHKGMVCALSPFIEHVKINFFKGVQLKDPHKLINNGLDSKNHRAIDFSQHDEIKEEAIIELIKEAVSLNTK